MAGEDPEPALVQRVHAIGKHLGKAARESIADNLVLESIMGKRLNIMDELQMRYMLESCHGARLIVLDTLSRIHQLDENSNGQMAQLVGRLEQLAAHTGAAVLYLHHVNKGSAKEGFSDQQQAARGASALIDNARWCGNIIKMSEEETTQLSDRSYDRRPIDGDRRHFFIRFNVSKQNYDATQMEKWFERQKSGVLVPVELVKACKKPSKPTGMEKEYGE